MTGDLYQLKTYTNHIVFHLCPVPRTSVSFWPGAIEAVPNVLSSNWARVMAAVLKSQLSFRKRNQQGMHLPPAHSRIFTWFFRDFAETFLIQQVSSEIASQSRLFGWEVLVSIDAKEGHVWNSDWHSFCIPNDLSFGPPQDPSDHDTHHLKRQHVELHVAWCRQCYSQDCDMQSDTSAPEKKARFEEKVDHLFQCVSSRVEGVHESMHCGVYHQ